MNRNSMNRRRFISSSGVAALALGQGWLVRGWTLGACGVKPVLMKLGCQSAPTNEAHLEVSGAVWSEEYLRVSARLRRAEIL